MKKLLFLLLFAPVAFGQGVKTTAYTTNRGDVVTNIVLSLIYSNAPGGGSPTTNASDLTTGTLPDARLSSNVPLKDAANVFTKTNAFSGGEFHVSGSGETVSLVVTNSNTGVAFSRLLLQTELTGADPFISFLLRGGNTWHVGMDNSDGDAFNIGTSTFPGGNPRLHITQAGTVTMPGSVVSGTGFTGNLSGGTNLPPTTGIAGWPANAIGALQNDGAGNLSWSASGQATNVTDVAGSSSIDIATNGLLRTPTLSATVTNQWRADLNTASNTLATTKLGIYSATAERREYESDFTYSTNQAPFNPGQFGWRVVYVNTNSTAVANLTNNWNITNGYLKIPRLSGTNLTGFYLTKGTDQAIQGAKARVRWTGGDTNGVGPAFTSANRSAVILVNEVPITNGVGISGWFLHLTFQANGFKGELYTNGLAGVYAGEGTGRPGVWTTVLTEPGYPADGDQHEVGFEMLSPNTMKVFCGGRETRLWTLDGFTNLFNTYVGRGTNIVFEQFPQDATNYALAPEFVSLSHWTDGRRDVSPPGFAATLAADGTTGLPNYTGVNGTFTNSLTATNVITGGLTNHGSSSFTGISRFTAAGFMLGLLDFDTGSERGWMQQEADGTVQLSSDGGSLTNVNAATMTVVDGTDATSFPALFDSATGTLAIKTDGALLYNASSGLLTATTFAGAGGGLTYTGSGNNGNLATSVDTLQELNDAVDNLALSGTPLWFTNPAAASSVSNAFNVKIDGNLDVTGEMSIATLNVTDLNATNLLTQITNAPVLGTDANGKLELATANTDYEPALTDSASLRTTLSDESGTGAAIFAGGAIGAATATTPAENDNDTSVATTAYVQTELAGISGAGIPLLNGAGTNTVFWPETTSKSALIVHSLASQIVPSFIVTNAAGAGYYYFYVDNNGGSFAQSLLATNLLTLGTLELGHLTDTTISRVSAGVIAVEGATLAKLTDTVNTTNAGNIAFIVAANIFRALNTFTNGLIATNVLTAGNTNFGLFRNNGDVNVTGTATSAVAVVTTAELGHATDTTLARASAGNLTVEGNALYRAGGTDVAVADGGTGIGSGTSGGVLGFTASGTIASSAALAANAIVIGGGAGATPTTTTTGTGVLTGIGNTVNAAGGFVTTDGTATLTGKTWNDASNTRVGIQYMPFQRPDYGDGAGAVPQTNSYVASGLMHYTLSGNAETNANWIVYEGWCPTNLNTAVEMTATFTFLSGGTDADDYVFHLTYEQAANGAAYATGTTIDNLPISMSVTPTTAANGDIQQSATTTLTGWAAALTPGRPMQIRLARLQNTQDDAARDVMLVIGYGSTD